MKIGAGVALLALVVGTFSYAPAPTKITQDGNFINIDTTSFDSINPLSHRLL